MANVIIVIVIAAILTAAVTYIVKAKRSGVKCIGCPSARTCKEGMTGKTNCCCSEIKSD